MYRVKGVVAGGGVVHGEGSCVVGELYRIKGVVECGIWTHGGMEW